MDMILVGDSAAMAVLGHESTVPITVDEMIMLTRAVARGTRRALIMADMPFGSYQVSDTRALENAVRLVKDGRADAVVASWDLGIRSQPVWTWLSGFRGARFFTAVH